MQLIQSETIEQVWHSIADLDHQTAAHEMETFAQQQPELLAFVMAWGEELDSEEAAEIALYLQFIIYRAFQEAAEGAGLPMIKADWLVQQLEQNSNVLEQLQDADAESWMEAAARQTGTQTNLAGFVAEVLTEPPDEESFDKLSEQDMGSVFLLLKSVIDVMDRETQPAGDEPPA